MIRLWWNPKAIIDHASRRFLFGPIVPNREAMLGRLAASDAALDGCDEGGIAAEGRAGDAGAGRVTCGAGGLADFGGNGKPPTARARVGLDAVGGFFPEGSFACFLTPWRARRPLLPRK